ncbi:hypothetical protein DFQ29_006106, partial [Apophysomyces sp. BC1021]
LQATKEFEEAVYYALQRTTDNEKFIELQYVFKEFAILPLSGTTKTIIGEVIMAKLQWEAFGGDLSLLRDTDGPDIDGWLESTATRQVLIRSFDVNQVYDLLGDEVSSEVQRIYKIQYSQPTPQVNPLIETDDSRLNALICLSQTCGKVGVTKGVHFGGSLSTEDAVELVNETDIAKLMRLVSVASKPRVEYMERRTVSGTSINTHAFLPNDFLDDSTEDSGFVTAAMMHHIESNGGELQPSTRSVRYFVMYVTYRELVFDPKYTKGTDKFKQAVTKALNMKLDKEKYQELQKVFGRFGYYYPSSISLGGGSLVTGCQDWIDSVQTNQTRTQFGTLRPIYELLEDEQRVQVLRLYDGSHSYIDSFPEIPKGLHFDGTEAEDQVIELIEDTTDSKMIMLRNFSDQPNIACVKRYLKGVKDIEEYLSLDIDTDRKLPGSVGFVLGSQGTYKERSTAREHYYSKPEATYDVAYVTFKEASGRIAFSVSAKNQEDQNPTQDKKLEISFKEVFEHRMDHKSAIAITSVEKSLAKSENWSSIGGDTDVLLSNDVKGWINTVKLNQTTTRRRGLKPIYELLDKEQRHKVQQTYENVNLEDVRVRYGYPLELTSYEDKLRDDLRDVPKPIYNPMRVGFDYMWGSTSYEDKPRDDLKDVPKPSYTPTDALFEQLLTQVFPDKIIAIQFCRSACDDYGFSVVEEEVTDRIIWIYCSRRTLSESNIRNIQDEHQSFCQWGIMLFKNDEAQWQFRKLATNDESMHNHPVPIGETQNYRDLQDTDKRPTHLKTNTIMIKPATETSVYDQGTRDAQYVRYGDMVKLSLEKMGRYHPAHIGSIRTHRLARDEWLAFEKEIERSESRVLWFVASISATFYSNQYRKVVPFSSTSAKDDSETDGKEEINENYDYVRKNDLVMFECQLSLKGNVRVYFSFDWDSCSPVALNRFQGVPDGACVYYYIKHKNRFAYLENRRIGRPNEYRRKERIPSILESDDDDDDTTLDNYLKRGSAYMYGVHGININNEKALKYLQLAADRGSRIAFYELGNLYWRVEEHKKALKMFEEAALLSVNSVYRKLGDIYRAEFSVPHETTSFTIPQNQRISFMYYSVGGIFGDATAALKIGEYYEKGLNEDFRIDHNKALQWYEYVSNQFEIPVAASAVGRIKHILANAAKDLSERDELRREAYKVFEVAALNDPYARFMVAMYNLNGWGCQQSDPVQGFDMLLSLVETGLNMVLHGIAKCYEKGVGVERNLAKALAYQELAARMDAQ